VGVGVGVGVGVCVCVGVGLCVRVCVFALCGRECVRMRNKRERAGSNGCMGVHLFVCRHTQ